MSFKYRRRVVAVMKVLIVRAILWRLIIPHGTF